ncbi:MAG: biopolymer transporter ExbD [Deltaproteobacteria bacterium]|nr:biopolymer transporter ExbD [Deltaproteobacteria bacterium]
MDRFRPKRGMSLQLTSLLDMFTIILVFLLESFQADDEDFVLHADVELPSSTAKSPFKSAVNIAVSPEAVFVEGERIFELNEGGTVEPALLEAGQIEEIVVAVEEAWQSRAALGLEEVVATIQADEALPYHTIDLVMRSAGWAGCYRFRMVVERK